MSYWVRIRYRVQSDWPDEFFELSSEIYEEALTEAQTYAVKEAIRTNYDLDSVMIFHHEGTLPSAKWREEIKEARAKGLAERNAAVTAMNKTNDLREMGKIMLRYPDEFRALFNNLGYNEEPPK